MERGLRDVVAPQVGGAPPKNVVGAWPGLKDRDLARGARRTLGDGERVGHEELPTIHPGTDIRGDPIEDGGVGVDDKPGRAATTQNPVIIGPVRDGVSGHVRVRRAQI